jgi:hypothetical protein
MHPRRLIRELGETHAPNLVPRTLRSYQNWRFGRLA